MGFSASQPKEFIHRLRVIYAHTDQMKVVYYGRYFEFMEAARNEFLREIGFEYKRLEATGVLLPAVEVHANYLSPARYDDHLAIHTTIERLENIRVRIGYRIFREGGEECLLTGYTVHAFITTQGKPVRLPKEFLELFLPYAP